MKEVIYNENDIKAWIYNRLDTESYYLYISEFNKRFRRTLKTDDLIRARQKSYNIIESYKSGVFNTPHFEEVAKEYLKTVQNEKTAKYYRDRLTAVFNPYFKDLPINQISEQLIFGLQTKRLENIKPVSVNKEMVVLKQVLRFAQKKRYIKEIPNIDKMKETKNKRNAFSDGEIAELCSIAQQRIADTNNSRTKYERTVAYLYIRFLLATGIREGEALSIQFGGICGDTAKLTSSKTKVREIFLNDEAKHIINELKETYHQYNISTNNHSFIFLNYKGLPVKSFKKSFNELLKNTTMAETIGKNELTLYSLRHTFITNAIKKGIPLTSIAIQCGTSLKMIESNYNHLTIHLVKNDLK